MCLFLFHFFMNQSWISGSGLGSREGRVWEAVSHFWPDATRVDVHRVLGLVKAEWLTFDQILDAMPRNPWIGFIWEPDSSPSWGGIGSVE
jgi:hypothetical protein